MPSKKRAKPLYQRGDFRLYPARPGRSFLEIVWYDTQRGRERSASAGTADVAEGCIAVDRKYLELSAGESICPTCGQVRLGSGSAFVTAAVADYLISAENKPSIGAIRPRLDHIVSYIAAKNLATVRCSEVDEAWIDRFRAWAAVQPIVSPSGKERARSLSTVENSVLQLAAAINWAHNHNMTPSPARFKPQSAKHVNRTPHYRADLPTLAAMFRFCLEPKAQSEKMRLRTIRSRRNLLHFLRLSVATWCRPDAAHDVSTKAERRQWLTAARVLNLNPAGRRQTKKYRPTLPIARQFAPHLDACSGPYVAVDSVRSAWRVMADELKLPDEGQSGMKLIRRSMATLARRRLGEEHWRQGEIMLGHVKISTSDVYALLEPAQLGRALRVTEGIIDELEKLAPGAFYRSFTARGSRTELTVRAPQPKELTC